MKWSRLCLALLILPLLRAEAPLRLLHTLLFQSDGNGSLEGLAFAADGTVLAAGTLGHSAAGALGDPAPDSLYCSAFAVRVHPETGERLHEIRFAPGLLHLTSILEAQDGSIYLAGYGTAPLSALFQDLSPFQPNADFSHKRLTRWAPWVHRHDPQINPARDERGVPVVLRLSPDLQTLLGGTWLEGWHSVWHVPPPLGEDQWQPVDLALLPGGDLLVSHDGGSIRDPGNRPPDHREFYHLPDHVSRLSPDLRQRRWRTDVFTPRMDRAKIRTHLGWDWPHDTLGNTRILRMRAHPDGSSFTVTGWSPSETAKEPWWSPFCFVYSADGSLRQTLYTPSPMDGDDDRLNHQVSDAAVQSVHYAADGHLLLCVKGDGGNSILRRDPLDFRREPPAGTLRGDLWGFQGRTLFWGGLMRVHPLSGELDRGQLLNGRDARRRLTPAWPVDTAPLQEEILLLTRHSTGFRFTPDAWARSEFPASAPGASLLLLSPEMNPRFATSLGDWVPARLETRGRFAALAGTARSGNLLSLGDPPPLRGATAGVLMIVERVPPLP